MWTCVLLLSDFRVEVLPIDPECAEFFWLPLHLGVSLITAQNTAENY